MPESPAAAARDPRAAARLADPAVTEKIRAVLKKRVRGSEIDDLVQKTLLRALMLPKLPESDDELLRLVATIAHGLLVDLHRSDARSTKRVADGQSPDEVATGGDVPTEQASAEAREALAWVDREVELGRVPPEAVRWSRDLAAGATFKEIAAREGKSASAIKVALHRSRKVLRERWGAFAALGAVIFAMLYALRQEPSMVSAPPPPESSVEGRTPAERAEALRRRAFDECEARRWDECLRDLEEAKGLDPSGDETDRVKAERKKANEARGR